MNENNLHLTLKEIEALQKILGFCLYHTSPELYSVATKLEDISSADDMDYDSVVFSKISDDGSVIKTYKHQNFCISIKR